MTDISCYHMSTRYRAFTGPLDVNTICIGVLTLGNKTGYETNKHFERACRIDTVPGYIDRFDGDDLPPSGRGSAAGLVRAALRARLDCSRPHRNRLLRETDRYRKRTHRSLRRAASGR